MDIEGMSRDVSAVAAHLQVCVGVCETETDRERQREMVVCLRIMQVVCVSEREER